MPPPDTTLPVVFSVSARPVRSGSLVAVASADVEVCGVPLTLSGFTVRVSADGGATVHVPQHRDPTTGRWADSVVLPEELAAAIGREILERCGIQPVE